MHCFAYRTDSDVRRFFLYSFSSHLSPSFVFFCRFSSCLLGIEWTWVLLRVFTITLLAVNSTQL